MDRRFILAALLASASSAACGDDLCEDANAVCSAAESENDISFDRDCQNEETECLASCIVDADDCSPETLIRCDDICRPFLGS